MEPPDSFPNSEVKRLSADGSVVCPCESRSLSAPYLTPLFDDEGAFTFCLSFNWYINVKKDFLFKKFFCYLKK